MTEGFIRSMQPVAFESPGLVGFRCQFSVDHYQQSMMLQLPQAVRLTERAVAKRQAEYLAGRLCARACLQQLGLTPDWVTVGAHRSPVWPAGVRGSITHTAQQAICICTANPAIRALGVDLELLLDTATADSIAGQILTGTEQQLLASLGGDLATFVTRVFSAKEAIFKGLYPYVQRYFGFDAVSLTKIEGEQLHFVLNQELHGIYPQGRALKLRSLDEPGQILSLLLDTD